jgi:integrase
MIRVLVRSKGAGRNLLLYFVDPITGKERSRSSKTTEAKEAERAAARWEAELVAHRGRSGAGWGYFRERFENEHLADKNRKTKNSYINALDHFERLISVENVTQINSDHVSQVRGKLLDEGRPVATVANILTHCRTAFKWAERIGMIARAPVFSMPKQINRKFMRGRPIGDQEFLAMLEKCHVPSGKKYAPQWQRFLKLVRHSGLRLEEAAELRWNDPPIGLMLEAKPHPVICFYGEAQKSRADELMPITPTLAEWLRETPRAKRSGLVAPVAGERIQELGAQAIGRGVADIGAAAGIVVEPAKGEELPKYASAHDLRRAFGREWAQKVKPMILMRMMRHKSITTTMKYYAHLESEDIGAALWGEESRAKSRTIAPSGKQRKQSKPKTP